MSVLVKVLLPVATFVVGYAGARSLSAGTASPAGAGEALPTAPIDTPTAVSKRLVGAEPARADRIAISSDTGDRPWLPLKYSRIKASSERAGQ